MNEVKLELPELDNNIDDGTMPNNVQELADAIIGHSIIDVTKGYKDCVLTLDNGTIVILSDTNDCCAFTEMKSVLFNITSIPHVITNIKVNDDYTQWFVLADAEKILEINLDWSPGNPFYYGYGFWISVAENQS